MVQCKKKKKKKNGEQGTIKNCTIFTGHWILSEQLKWQGYNGEGIYIQWAIMKYTEESWTSDSKEGQWGGLNFCGWMVQWKI